MESKPLLLNTSVFIDASISASEKAELCALVVSEGGRLVEKLTQATNLLIVSTDPMCRKHVSEKAAAKASFVKPTYLQNMIAFRTLALDKTAYDPSRPSGCFHGLTIHACHLFQRSELVEIQAMVIFNGGVYADKPSRDCTHIVCGNPALLVKSRLPKLAKVVSVAWVYECSRLKQQLTEAQYPPEAPYSRARTASQEIEDKNADKHVPPLLLSTATLAALGEPSNAAGHKSRLFAGLIFCLDSSSYADPQNLTKYNTLLTEHGATVLPTYSAMCTHFICMYQEGETYKQAVADKKIVTTLYWVDDVLQFKSLDITKSFLHVPVLSSTPDPAMRKLVVVQTNFVGKERQIIKELCFYLGVCYNGHLSRNTTHLVCLSTEGDKYKHAVDWNVQVVNVQWIVDMFESWSVPKANLPKYSVFRNVSLTALLAHAVEPMSESTAPFMPSAPNSLAMNSHAVISAMVDPVIPSKADTIQPHTKNNTASAGKTLAGNSAARAPAIEDVVMAEPNALITKSKTAVEMPDVPPPTATTTTHSTTTGSAAASAEPLPYFSRGSLTASESETKKDDSKSENKQSSSKQFAAVTAAQNARKNTTPTVLETAGKPTSTSASASAPAEHTNGHAEGPQKRERSPSSSTSSISPSKRPAVGTGPAKKSVRAIMFSSGCTSKDRAVLSKMCASLGVRVTDDPHEASHLVMDKMKRTAKFLMVLCLGPIIVTSQWIRDSMSAGKFLAEDAYFLNDEEFERKHNFSLSASCQSARRRPFLDKITIYLTPSVFPDLKTMQELIECAGGKVLLTAPPQHMLETQMYGVGSTSGLIIVSSSRDREIWRNYTPYGHIYSTEFILSGVLRQKLPFNDEAMWIETLKTPSNEGEANAPPQ